ncbi:dimethylsulfonioproprionate lyase family protein [Aestuariispira insulae]|uniref:Dimethlysulfoniopropionate lyase n=1 Tax=Aestuariispira insulae TaxID=1461337 RepID=A0A3D9HWS9_9PROT|nr:dimethylsulfonioproprionate lyase family protein [Aestuariispira insulae]RED53869.1 dimethlysulfoniopropionate lyase [Aestuariispira insulae]
MTIQAGQSLFRSLKALLAGIDHPVLQQFMQSWPEERPMVRELATRPLPVLSWLEEARRNAAPEASPVVQFLCNHADELFWSQTYSIADFGEQFLDRYAWCEIVGQRGVVESDQIACGFLMLGPDTEYPRHWHAAEEIFIPLSAPSHWVRIEEGDWTRLKAMDIAHFTANQPHGLRTGNGPLVAVYFWRGGDLVQKARI